MNTQSREVNSLRNLIVGAINQVVFLFLNLVAKTVFIKTLGTEFLGINGLLTNIFMLLSFAEFGIGSVMVYSLYEPIAKEEINKITVIYHFFKKIYFIMSVITIGIGVLMIPMLKFILNTDIGLASFISYYLIFLINIIISNTYIYKSHLILADQNKYILVLYQMLFDGITLIFQIISLLLTDKYMFYLLIVLGKHIIFSFTLTRKVNRLYPFIKNKVNNQISGKQRQHIVVKIIDVTIYRFARVLLTGTDNIIISILVGTVWVGYYSNYDLIIVGVLSLVTTFYSAISASIGNLIVKETVDNQRKIFNITQVLNFWIVGFTTTCLFILFQDFITLWLGEVFLLDPQIVTIIVFNYYLVCTRNTIKVFREAAGMFEKVKYVMILAAIINIILSILMGMGFGIFGILSATTITALSTYYWYEAKFLMESKFGSSLKVYLISQLKSITLTLLSILITYLCVSMINKVTIGTFIVKLVICLVVPNVFYFLVLNREKEFQEILMILIRNYKKFING